MAIVQDKCFQGVNVILTEDSVGGVHCHLVLCSVTNKPLCVSEGNIAGSGPVTLVIGNDFHLAMLEDTHAGISGAKINSNRWSLRHCSCEQSNI